MKEYMIRPCGSLSLTRIHSLTLSALLRLVRPVATGHPHQRAIRAIPVTVGPRDAAWTNHGLAIMGKSKT